MALLRSQQAEDVAERRVRLHLKSITSAVNTLEQLAGELSEADGLALRAFVRQARASHDTLVAMSSLLDDEDLAPGDL